MNTPSIGQQFGKWIVIEYLGKLRYSKDYWKCRCECGTERIVSGATLRDGRSTNCGCVRKEKTGNLRRSHGMSNSPEYHSWWAIHQRCYDPNYKQFQNYGGRGIRICDRWLKSFDNFYSDMGSKPSPAHSIERIDNNGDYSPDNCHWADQLEQAHNKRNNHYITHNGNTLTLTEWARKIGISESGLFHRLKLGWSIKKALTTPSKSRSRRSTRNLDI